MLLRALLLALATSCCGCDAFTVRVNSPILGNVKCHRAPQSFKATSDGDDTSVTKIITTTYEATLASDQGQQQSSKRQWLRRILRKKNIDAPKAKAKKLYRFTYDYNEMVMGNTPAKSTTTTAVMLIHPIGVGIGKWYYDRLLNSLQERYGDINHRLVFLAPDLLGSATASGPVDTEDGEDPIQKTPLYNITDWTSQITQLMVEYEAKSEDGGHVIGSWSVVANGGCAPIALKVASTSTQNNASFNAAVTNVIISSPPRLPFFIESTSDPTKVRKSYRTLSGITGRLFWWYSLRKEGRFIQKFSEKNLVGDAASLGEDWTPNCLKAARLHNGLSRYSTFAFLAGSLQDGCLGDLNALKGSNVMIDFIRGSDKRRNRAKSVFWARKKKKESADSGSKEGADTQNDTLAEETIQQYVYKNGNRGKELLVGGRISLAWEDSSGYAKSLMDLLCE